MAPAKVTTSKGKVFFVPDGEEIAEKGRDKHFNPEALKDLERREIYGTPDGFKEVDVIGIRRTKFYSEWGVKVREGKYRKVLVRGSPILKLRDGTKIEPVTEEGMEFYKKRVERR